ncbi:hypothetical protein COLO4_19732 [Corchorus olitorius]|uniref:Cytochrome b561, eukaryote n=1 Tax=Corchorus olitorius TaxID=93759 RepID=A0A1R3J3U5_9ROSI|nr:hypothetical protein COLO4_19732 [Corchorus olitorius]
MQYVETSSKVWSFVLSAPVTNSYVSIGFSSNGKMVKSSCMVGWISGDGTPTMKQYYLGGTKTNQVIADQGNLMIVANSSSITAKSSRIYLAFQLNTSQPSQHLIYAVGKTGAIASAPDYALADHRAKISTLLSYSTAIVARYMKQWDPIWFYSHAVFQSCAFILGIFGMLSGFVLEDRLNTEVSTHKGLGIFIIALASLQVTALFVRPGKESKVRKYWNWYHHTAGRLLIVLAIANVFYGIHLGEEGNGWNVGEFNILEIMDKGKKLIQEEENGFSSVKNQHNVTSSSSQPPLEMQTTLEQSATEKSGAIASTSKDPAKTREAPAIVDKATKKPKRFEIRKPMLPQELENLAKTDPKKAKRIIQNRSSAKRSKEKKKLYECTLNHQLDKLTSMAATLSTKLTSLETENKSLVLEHSKLKDREHKIKQMIDLQQAKNDEIRKEIKFFKSLQPRQIPNEAVHRNMINLNSPAPSVNGAGHQAVGPSSAVAQQDLNSANINARHHAIGPFIIAQPGLNFVNVNGQLYALGLTMAAHPGLNLQSHVHQQLQHHLQQQRDAQDSEQVRPATSK